MNSEIRSIKWGIIGLGKIARKFADDLLRTDGCELYAVASRTLLNSEKFAKDYHVYHAYGDYLSLAEDPNIDAVYIATPHSRHKKDTLLCLRNKKAVLCEKPMSLCLDDVMRMTEFAKEHNILLMEALWTRFLPSYQFVKSIIDSGELGNVRTIEADFGFKADYSPQDRLFDKKLGGGSLLDIGIYPIFLALDILGEPEDINANATFFETGADSSVNMTFRYKNGPEGKLKSTLLEETLTTAIINCDNGSIKMHGRFHEPTSVTVNLNGNSETHNFTTESHGYNYEICHFNKLIRSEKTESDFMTFEFSKMLSKTMDRVKDQIGLKYDKFEEKKE